MVASSAASPDHGRDGRVGRHRRGGRPRRDASGPRRPAGSLAGADAHPPRPPRRDARPTAARLVAGAGRAAPAPAGRRRRAGRRGAGASSPRCATGGDDAVRELTERFDGVRLDDLRVPPDELQAALDRIPDRPARGARAWPRRTSRPTTETQVERRPTHERRTASRSARWPCPVDRAGCYVPGGRAALPVHRADDGARGQGGRRAARSCWPRRPAGTGSIPDSRWPPPRWPASTRCTGSAARRPSPRWPTARSRSTPVDVIVGPGQRLRRHRQAGGGAGGPGRRALGVRRPQRGRGRRRRLGAGRLRRHRRHRPGRARPRRPGLADLVGRGRARRGRRARSPASSPPNPRRARHRGHASPQGGHAVLVDSPEDAVAVSNAIAPEHLELLVADARRRWSPLVRHAGAVFTGAVVAGQRRRLRGRAVARAADLRLGPLRPGADRGRLHQARPRRRPGRGRRCATVGAHVIALAEEEGLPAHADVDPAAAGRPP